MTPTVSLLLSLLAQVIPGSSPAPPMGLLIDSGQGQIWMVPRPEPYRHSGPAVCAGGSQAPLGRTASGQPVWAFHLVSWQEGDAYRVVVSAIVPEGRQKVDGRGACNGVPLIHTAPGFDGVDLGTVLVRPGQQVSVEQMRQVGATPWTISARPLPPAH
jgi:hypothetical protein